MNEYNDLDLSADTTDGSVIGVVTAVKAFPSKVNPATISVGYNINNKWYNWIVKENYTKKGDTVKFHVREGTGNLIEYGSFETIARCTKDDSIGDRISELEGRINQVLSKLDIVLSTLLPNSKIDVNTLVESVKKPVIQENKKTPPPVDNDLNDDMLF